MKSVLLGAVLGLLLIVCPAVMFAVVTKPFVLAFAVGVVVRPALARRMRWWTA